ncbi:MAG: lysozyme [Ruminococcus sp.]|nr:lysozyme [Ruminococcus sp.]
MIKKKLAIVIAICIVIVFTFGYLLYKNIITLSNPKSLGYTIKGVDVSEYQGDIDWQILSNQDIQFAFIKATEGSSYVDPNFLDNFTNALNTNLRVGAYHFFSFESSGKTQAKNFIDTVPIVENSLPNVVDVELYGDFKSNPLDVQSVVKELTTMLQSLEDTYKSKPIIYTTKITYNLYIKDNFPNYSIWLRDVHFSHNVKLTPNVDFWQYSSTQILDGYNGDEQYIDMNVFCGSQDDFNNYNKIG